MKTFPDTQKCRANVEPLAYYMVEKYKTLRKAKSLTP